MPKLPRGLAANGHMMMVGETGEESPFAANPRRNAAFQMSRLKKRLENAKAICALLRGRWVAGELSYGVRALQRQRKRHQHDPSGFRFAKAT